MGNPIKEYLDLVGKDFDRFEIQRKREQHKGYSRLKRDIENGALIPTITLAIEPSLVGQYNEILTGRHSDKIKERLFKDSQNLYILDGLQRTYIINDLYNSKVEFNEEQILLLEIWFEPVINNLIYRLIVLNSGQKPMSMRHQIELLFMTMKLTLSKELPGLEFLQEKEQDKRTKPKQYAFDRLVTSYKAYLMKTAEVDKDNIVSERLIENDILDSEEEFLSSSFNLYKGYLAEYSEIDSLIFSKYSS